jgi:hypothetical protein
VGNLRGSLPQKQNCTFTFSVILLSVLLNHDMKEILGLKNHKCLTDYVLLPFHSEPYFCLPLLFTYNTIRERYTTELAIYTYATTSVAIAQM